MNLNTELAVGFDTAIRGTTALNDVETCWIMNVEHEEPRLNWYASNYEPIIPVVCCRGLASPISSKRASGFVSFNNETINAQNMEYVDRYHVQPEPLNTLKVTTSCGTNDLVTS